jgi:hypothetical protein
VVPALNMLFYGSLSILLPLTIFFSFIPLFVIINLNEHYVSGDQQLYLSQNKSIIYHFTFSLYNFYFTDTILVNRVQQQV